jgi:hypothetical protein
LQNVLFAFSHTSPRYLGEAYRSTAASSSGAAWHTFAQEFESHGHEFPTLQPYIAKVKEHKTPAGNLEEFRADYAKLARTCQTAVGIRQMGQAVSPV